MNTLTKTGENAGITDVPQVINPANNLPAPAVDDATVTKGDVKNAGTAAQVENAENAEPNKAKTLQALRKHFENFTPAGAAFDEKALRAALKAAGLKDDVINITVKNAAKKAAETVTVEEFINHINTAPDLKSDVLNYCGNASLDINNLILGDAVIIYHSKDDNGAGYVEQKINGVTAYYEEKATVTVSNLIKSVGTYSIKRNAIGKTVVLKGDKKLSVNSFVSLFHGITALGNTSQVELLQALFNECDNNSAAAAAFNVALRLLENANSKD